MRIKSQTELIVKAFVQSVSSATTFTKRYKKVCRLLDSRPQLTEEQWLYIWRGMYYCVWYSEMGKGCEELAQRIAIHDDISMLFSGFKALTTAWFGIDAFRIDKYMFLIRLMSNNCLKLQTNALTAIASNHTLNDISVNSSKTNDSNDIQINESHDKKDKEEEEVIDKSEGNEREDKSSKQKKNKKWNKKKDNSNKEIVFPIEIKAKIIDNILTIVKTSIGLTLHMTDVVIDELVKVLSEFRPKLKVQQKLELYFDILLPFIKLMAISEDYRVLKAIKENVFDKFKNEILIAESIDNRKLVLQKFIDAMVSIGAVETIGRKNRDTIYNIIGIFKTKLSQLTNPNDNRKSLKRKKIVLRKGNQKKVKYELTSSSPFVTSIVPIAVV